MNRGKSQYRICANLMRPGMNTVLSPRTGSPSTADAQKSPSTVDGMMRENEMWECPVARDCREVDLVVSEWVPG
jgi:hypothetical protein